MENKDLQNLSQDENKNSADQKTSESEKISKKDTLLSLATLFIFVGIIVIAFSSGCVTCTACGDNNNR